MIGRRDPPRLGVPIGLSAALHVAAVASLLFVRGERAPALPPMYRVNLIAAPAGERAIGAITPAPTAPSPTPPAPPRRAETVKREMPAPVKVAPKSRPQPSAATPSTVTPPKGAAATRAGGGPTGGRGTDVVNVRTEGIAFPYPGYLENIVRQIALNFKPPRSATPLRADVRFVIHRDGTVTDIRIVTSSGARVFDLEALGAVEAAGNARAFGALPDGFTNDILPVTFSFDPSLIR